MGTAPCQSHSADVPSRSRSFLPNPLTSVLLLEAIAVAGLFFIGGQSESGAGDKQAKGGGALFALVSPDTQLNPRQKKYLERIQKSVAVVDVKVVRADAELVLTKPGNLSLLLAGDKSLHIQGMKYVAVKGTDTETKGRLDLNWNGSAVTQFASFSVRGNSLTGLIYDDNKVYSVASIGDGLQALILLNPAKFIPDHPKEFEAILKKKIQDGPPPAPEPPPQNAKPVTVRVLVAYTPRVEDMQGDQLQALIGDALRDTNNSCKNSRVNLHVELAGIMKVDYTETKIAKDLAEFQQMKDVKMERKARSADICVLLVDSNDAGGMAAAILAEVKTAFAVVNHDYATWNFAFPHELGHLFGARHDIANDATIDPQYPWNHGFLPPRNVNWQTMMADGRGGQLRVPYWSNPYVIHPKTMQRMGTMAKEYNARMLNTTAEYVSKFRNKL